MRLFRVRVRDRGGKPHRLLVAAENEAEARSLVRRQGQVEQIQAKTGPCPLYGGSRVIGALLRELTA